MLSALKTGCVFQPSRVSLQVVLRGTPDTPSVKPFLSRSFVVCSTCVGGGSFFKLRVRVIWAAFGHVVESWLRKVAHYNR